MNARVFTLLVVSFIPGAFCLVLARLVLNTNSFADYRGLIDALLYLALAVCVFVAAITNFRDENGVLFEITLLENVKIPRLHVMIGLFLIPLILLNGLNILDRSKVRISQEHEMVERMKRVSQELSDSIQASRESVLARLDEVSSELSDSVGTSRDSVLQRLDGVSSKLSKKIDSSRNSVLKRLNGVNSALSDSVRTSTDSVLDSLNGARSALSDSMRASRDSVMYRLKAVKDSLAAIDSLIRCCGY